jgi:TRAP-type uncharacterized transport system substrate-binding protein
MQAGLELKPVESGGAFDTAAAVCNGQAAAAIVQRDAVVQPAYAPACQGRFDVAGRSLYSYYAFLVVKAGAPFRTLNDLANEGRDGGKRMIAVGAEGSGGRSLSDSCRGPILYCNETLR